MTKKVYTYAVADVLHIGHLRYLKKAKQVAGEDGILIVGVLTDSATMEKKSKPVLSHEERIEIIKELKCVDEVIYQHTYSPIDNILLLKPDILIESESHTEEDLKNTLEIVNTYGGKIQVLPYHKDQSSTRIKDKIKETLRNE